MDRNSIMWILECCLLNLDDVSKKQMLEFGCPKELIDIGMQLYSYLKNKEIAMEMKNDIL